MPARGRRGGGFPIVAGIILLAVLGVVLWLFLRSGGAGGSTESETQTGTTAAAGTVTANGEDLLAISAEGNPSAFTDLENEPAHAEDVTVQGVAGDGAFWIGTDADHRLLIVTGGGTSVGAGDRVSIDGTLRVLPVDFTDRYGISNPADQQLLQQQGHYIQAEQVSDSG
jgi:hypothetical protein